MELLGGMLLWVCGLAVLLWGGWLLLDYLTYGQRVWFPRPTEENVGYVLVVAAVVVCVAPR
jgi:hypothetical protein